MRRLFFSFASTSLLLALPIGGACRASAAADPQRSAGVSDWAEVLAHGCPVSLDVRHTGGLAATYLVGREDPKQPQAGEDEVRTSGPASQSFDFTAHNYSLRDITALDAVVHVRSGKALLMPVADDDRAEGDALPLHIHKAIGTSKDVAFSWSIPTAHSVKYIAIQKITYRDGTVWTAPADSSCFFAPSPMMLVSAVR